MPNTGSKTSRTLALNLDYFRIDRGEVVFGLGMRGAGKSALHDVIESIFHLSESERDNIIIPQCKQDKPSVEIAKLWRALDCRFHSQSGKVAHVPDTNEKVLLFCDDPTNEGVPTGLDIIDQVLERKHTMLIGKATGESEKVEPPFSLPMGQFVKRRSIGLKRMGSDGRISKSREYCDERHCERLRLGSSR